MDEKLSKYVKQHYPDSKSDLFAVFMEACHNMTAENGYQAMITMHSWMFLSSFEKLRAKIQKLNIVNMVHLGARAFEEIGGEVVQTTSFVLTNKHIDGYKGTYCRLVEPTTQAGKEEMFLAKENRYVVCSDNFAKIPGAPVAYWVSDKLINIFQNSHMLADYTLPKVGLQSGNTDLFIRLWYEVSLMNTAIYEFDDTKKWYPLIKGGTFRKWYGNNFNIINWENNGSEIKKCKGARPQNLQYYFKPMICCQALTNNENAYKYESGGKIPDVNYRFMTISEKYLKIFLGLMNTSIVSHVTAVFSVICTPNTGHPVLGVF